MDVRVFISLEIILDNNTYPRRIRRRSNLGHIFRGKKCVSWAGKYGTCIIVSLICTMFLQRGRGGCAITQSWNNLNILVKTRFPWKSALVQRQALSQNWKGKVEGTSQFKLMILNDISDTCSHRHFKCFWRMWPTATLLWKPQNLQCAVKLCISLLEIVRNKDLNRLNCNNHGTDPVKLIVCTSDLITVSASYTVTATATSTVFMMWW
jgi:hypothetical protein